MATSNARRKLKAACGNRDGAFPMTDLLEWRTSTIILETLYEAAFRSACRIDGYVRLTDQYNPACHPNAAMSFIPA